MKKRVKAGTSKVDAAKLTSQQERFAQRLVTGGSQSDAYRAIYPHCRKWQAKSVHEAASKLAAKVAPRVAELRAPVIAEIRYGLKEAMTEAARALKLAETNEQAGAMVAAVQLRSKLNGLLVEERRNERAPFEELTDAELERAAAETERAIARAQSTSVADTHREAATDRPK